MKEITQPGVAFAVARGVIDDECADYIGYLADHNLGWSEIDTAMKARHTAWCVGDARRYWMKYPKVREDVKAARAIVLREAGASKALCFKTYVEAQRDAMKYTQTGAEYPDHGIRIAASDRISRLLGEEPTGSGAKTNISIGAGDHKIMVVTSSGREVKDAV